jgi:hypothetical protein
MPRDTAASSAIIGDMSPLIKNAAPIPSSAPISGSRNRSQNYSHPNPYATINSARLRCTTITTHHGSANARHITDNHSTPRVSEYHPAIGAAEKLVSALVDFFFKRPFLFGVLGRVEHLQKNVGTTPARYTSPTLLELSPQTSCRCSGSVGSCVL